MLERFSENVNNFKKHIGDDLLGKIRQPNLGVWENQVHFFLKVSKNSCCIGIREKWKVTWAAKNQRRKLKSALPASNRISKGVSQCIIRLLIHSQCDEALTFLSNYCYFWRSLFSFFSCTIRMFFRKLSNYHPLNKRGLIDAYICS